MARILIIDDDDAFRGALENLLQAAGHTVATAPDGQTGAKRYRAEPFDVVITDIVMEQGEGLETVMTLRREYPDVGVIAMSGDSSRSEFYLSVAKRLGAHRTFSKPFTMAELDPAIFELAPPRRRASPAPDP